jgi:hypothetical protein
VPRTGWCQRPPPMLKHRRAYQRSTQREPRACYRVNPNVSDVRSDCSFGRPAAPRPRRWATVCTGSVRRLRSGRFQDTGRQAATSVLETGDSGLPESQVGLAVGCLQRSNSAAPAAMRSSSVLTCHRVATRMPVRRTPLVLSWSLSSVGPWAGSPFAPLAS